MTYNNRILTTPFFINTFDSPFWNFVASDTAIKIKEKCPHSGKFMNMNVVCYARNERLFCTITCKKCDQTFYKTEKIVRNLIGHFGF